jgi:hypothetical protein
MITYEDENENYEIDRLNYTHEQPLEIKTNLLKSDQHRIIGNRIIEESI